MHPARIAELLQPFVGSSTHATAHRPSEPATAGEEPAVLSPAQLHHISTYINILLRWNARINLTAIRDPEEIVTRHFGESLFAARHLFPDPALETIHAGVETGDSPLYSRRSLPATVNPAAERRQNAAHGASRGSAAPETEAPKGRETSPVNNLTPAPERLANDERPSTNGRLANDRLADLGSGAGFPGIPIKLWAPHIALTLIESNQKKTAFLREIIRALTLTNVNVFPARAQELLRQRPDDNPTAKGSSGQPAVVQPAMNRPGVGQPSDQSAFDLVTLRAVERFADVLPIAASLVSPGGRLVLLVGASQLHQAQTSLPTFSWDPPFPVPRSLSRTLLIAHRP
jgi:16S rRNA (guanine(527)-N(7))-methyltransferase RsmG